MKRILYADWSTDERQSSVAALKLAAKVNLDRKRSKRGRWEIKGGSVSLPREADTSMTDRCAKKGFRVPNDRVASTRSHSRSPTWVSPGSWHQLSRVPQFQMRAPSSGQFE
jgi:hypothetical protein